MKCKSCGNEVQPGQAFCANCGSKVDTVKDNKQDEVSEKISKEVLKEVKKENTAEVQETTGQMEYGIPEYLINKENQMIFSENDVQTEENSKINKERRNLGFKSALLMAFVAFFFPFCTVSCSNNVIINPTGYELAGDWGMTAQQMEMLDMTVADTANVLIISALIVMFAAFIMTTRSIVNSVQMVIAAGLLITFKSNPNWGELDSLGCEVSFEFGYWLALTALILAMTASVWSPPLFKKIENYFIKENVKKLEKQVKFREKLNIFFSVALFGVVFFAVILNWTAISSWGDAYSGIKDGKTRPEYSQIMSEADSNEDIPQETSGTLEESYVSDISEEINRIETTDADKGIVKGNDNSNYILPDSSIRYIGEDELVILNKDTLRLARNEIYARHGRKFETEDLKGYFNTQTWYSGYLSADEFDDSVLNEYEKANLDLIKRVEENYSSENENFDKINGQGALVLSIDDVWNSEYGSNGAPVVMTLGQTENGYYIQFTRTDMDGEGLIWSGEPQGYKNDENGGLIIQAFGEDLSQGISNNAILIRWNSPEEIDHPYVSAADKNENYAITGEYSY